MAKQKTDPFSMLGDVVRPLRDEVALFHEIMRHLDYRQDVAEFYWRTPGRGRQLDRRAGHRNAAGYWLIGFRGVSLFQHRLVWWLENGRPNEIDGIVHHIDQQPDNNLPDNLTLTGYTGKGLNKYRKKRIGKSGLPYITLVDPRSRTPKPCHFKTVVSCPDGRFRGFQSKDLAKVIARRDQFLAGEYGDKA